ncbi:MAG: ATPase, T2SS/T4P/T4SS family [Conexivisphaerales archaeon]
MKDTVVNLKSVVSFLKPYKYSDIQITVGKKISYRLVTGFVDVPFSPIVTNKFSFDLVNEMIGYYAKTEEERKKTLDKFLFKRHLDFAFDCEDERFRTAIYFEKGNVGASLRRLQNRPLFLDELLIDPRIANYIEKGGGLILIAGKTASGKTTTAVALIQHLTRKKSGLHVVSIEDPIEYVIPHGNCIVEQRELGTDVIDYQSALVSIVRENPDFVFFGEIRDEITARYAILLASTGHTVLATFHAFPAVNAFERFVSLLQSQEDRHLFASSFTAVVAQKLENYNGIFYPVFEIVEQTPAIERLVREGQFSQITATYKGNGYVLSIEESQALQIARINRLLGKSEQLERKIW